MPDSSAPTANTRVYWCFISYRHVDNKESGRQWATWLHQTIETYEVPIELVGTLNNRGEIIPSRIFPVFRDEEELPANSDLASHIYRALENSKSMLVLCSPRATQSHYIAQELAYFKKLGKSDRIMALMIEGEPNARWDDTKQSNGFKAEQECFPEFLRHEVDADGHLQIDKPLEPIAADMRLGTAQGWTSPEAYRQALEEEGTKKPSEIRESVAAYTTQSRLAKLKILAGILGVDLGMLTQRDSQYRLELAAIQSKLLRRWLMAVAGLTILSMTLGTVAWRQKKIAVEGKREALLLLAQSEHKLELATQKLAAAEKENADEKAQQLLAEKERDDAKAETAHLEADLAAGLLRSGLSELSQNQLDAAEKDLTRALALHQKLLASDPNNQDLLGVISLETHSLSVVQKAKHK